MSFIDIGQVAEKTGLRPSTLRYYEAVGLIASVSRRGLRRQFPGDVLLRLRLIAMGQTAGFSLAEISQMFGSDGSPDLPRAALRKKADALDRQINDLIALRDTLRHVADCRAPSHMECPTFRRLITVTGKQMTRRPRQKKRAAH